MPTLHNKYAGLHTLGRLGRGCYEHENAERLRVKESQRTWGLSQESSFAFIGSSVTVSLTKDLPHVYALLFSRTMIHMGAV